MVEDGEEYEGTPGLWELIVSKKPDETLYTSDDKKNYARLMIKTNSIYRNNDPYSNNPKGNRRGDKWKYLLKDIWDNREKYMGKGIE